MDVLTNLRTYARDLHQGKIKTATKYLDEQTTVRLTLIGKPRSNDGRLHFTVAIGRPNFAERKFIKDCVKAGESFPVKKVQFKYRPVKTTKPKKS